MKTLILLAGLLTANAATGQSVIRLKGPPSLADRLFKECVRELKPMKLHVCKDLGKPSNCKLSLTESEIGPVAIGYACMWKKYKARKK